MQSPIESNELGGVMLGLALTLALHAVAGVLLFCSFLAMSQVHGNMPLMNLFQSSAAFSSLGVGISQVAYMGPATAFFWYRGRRAVAKGLIIGAAITFLLNAACWGVVAMMGANF